MKLTSLVIQLQPSYAENPGKYVATIQYEIGRQHAVTLVLDPEVSGKLLVFIGPVITEAAGKAAHEIEANIIGSLEEAAKPLEITV